MVTNGFIKTNKSLLKWTGLLLRKNSKSDILDKLHSILVLGVISPLVTSATAYLFLKAQGIAQITDSVYTLSVCGLLMSWYFFFACYKFPMNAMIHDLEEMVNLSKEQLKPHTKQCVSK